MPALSIPLEEFVCADVVVTGDAAGAEKRKKVEKKRVVAVTATLRTQTQQQKGSKSAIGKKKRPRNLPNHVIFWQDGKKQLSLSKHRNRKGGKQKEQTKMQKNIWFEARLSVGGW